MWIFAPCLRLGSPGMPNIQTIQDAHHIRFWAQAINSDERIGNGLRHDASTALALLQHPSAAETCFSFRINITGATSLISFSARLFWNNTSTGSMPELAIA